MHVQCMHVYDIPLSTSSYYAYMHCIDTLLDTTTVAMHRVCILSNYDRRMHNMHTMHSTLVDNTRVCILSYEPRNVYHFPGS